MLDGKPSASLKAGTTILTFERSTKLLRWLFSDSITLIVNLVIVLIIFENINFAIR